MTIDVSEISGFTPGPWKVFTDPTGTKIIGIGELNGAGVTDCGFGIWRGGDAECLANARLIAAAPDMHAEIGRLRGALATIVSLHDDANVETPAEDIAEYMADTARAALKGGPS